MSDALKWRWCNNRNRVRSKCNALESPWIHTPRPCLWKNFLPQNRSLIWKRLGTARIEEAVLLTWIRDRINCYKNQDRLHERRKQGSRTSQLLKELQVKASASVRVCVCVRARLSLSLSHTHIYTLLFLWITRM